MQDVARFQGCVDHCENGAVVVRITREETCGSCAAKDSCTTASQARRQQLIRVQDSAADTFLEGETVLLEASESMGRLAVVIGYLMPALVVVASLLMLRSFIQSEIALAGASLASLAVYYGILFLLKDRISPKMAFKILKVNE